MITIFFFTAVIYFFASVDFLLNQIPFISNASAYSSRIPDTINSFTGLFHQVLPQTVALVSFYITMYLAVWFVFFVLDKVKKMIPVNF